jgi:hypothetical protein
MHVENVRSVIEELEREYTILSDKLNEHEKQTDGKEFFYQTKKNNSFLF